MHSLKVGSQGSRIDSPQSAKREKGKLRSRGMRIFISYKHDDRSQELAIYLKDYLRQHGHHAFTDVDIIAAEKWPKRIDDEIKKSHYVIVLLSPKSADSEMVQAEVERAYNYQKLEKHPQILPVRLAYRGLLPYGIATYMPNTQYVWWGGAEDNVRVAREILEAVKSGQMPEHEPIQAQPLAGRWIAEDGVGAIDLSSISPPRPQFESRHLSQDLSKIKNLRDKLYVRRQADTDLERLLDQPGTITTLRAARQTGKTSLLVRGVQYALAKDLRVALLDIKAVKSTDLVSFDRFMRGLADSIADSQKLDRQQIVEPIWVRPLTPEMKLSTLMTECILPASDKRFVLAMDQVDLLLTVPFRNDFMGMLRSWCGHALGLEPRWERLNVVIAIDTDPWLLIEDIRRSPFNFCVRLTLEDFYEAQVRLLNQQYGNAAKKGELPQLMKLLNGHPYLTRQALYLLRNEGWTWNQLKAQAAKENGPFAEHLLYYDLRLHDQPKQREALKQIINSDRCSDPEAFYRLERAGLVKGTTEACECRCQLYASFFKDRL